MQSTLDSLRAAFARGCRAVGGWTEAEVQSAALLAYPEPDTYVFGIHINRIPRRVLRGLLDKGILLFPEARAVEVELSRRAGSTFAEHIEQGRELQWKALREVPGPLRSAPPVCEECRMTVRGMLYCEAHVPGLTAPAYSGA